MQFLKFEDIFYLIICFPYGTDQLYLLLNINSLNEGNSENANRIGNTSFGSNSIGVHIFWRKEMQVTFWSILWKNILKFCVKGNLLGQSMTDALMRNGSNWSHLWSTIAKIKSILQYSSMNYGNRQIWANLRFRKYIPIIEPGVCRSSLGLI